MEKSCSSIALESRSIVSWRDSRSSSIASLLGGGQLVAKAQCVPLSGHVDGDATHRGGLAFLVEKRELHALKGSLHPTDLKRFLGSVRGSFAEDLAVVGTGLLQRRRAHDRLIGLADQLALPAARELVRLSIREDVAVGAVLDVDRHRCHVDDFLTPLFEVEPVGAFGDFKLAPAQRVHRGDQQLAGPKWLDQVTVDTVAT